jgi:hypothetical protein
MIDSIPQWIVPDSCQATTGKEPASPRTANGGAHETGRAVEHRPRAEGHLRVAGLQTALADQGPLLVADEPGDHGTPRQRCRLADDSGRVDDRRQDAGIDAQQLEDRRVPGRSVRQDEARDARVRRVGHVDRACRERPGDPAVDRAEAQVPVPVGVVGVEQELELRRGLVGREAQAGCPKREAATGCPEVLPADARPEGNAGAAVPHDCRGALRRHRDGLHAAVPLEDRPRRLERCRCERVRVDLDQSGSGRPSGDARALDVEDPRVRADDRRAHVARADVDDEDAHRVTDRTPCHTTGRRGCEDRIALEPT